MWEIFKYGFMRGLSFLSYLVYGGSVMVTRQNTISHNEMIKIVAIKLQTCNLTLQYPEIVAQSLLSTLNYDLDKVLELAV